MIMKAVWNGKVIAESNETINVEGNYYFPEESVKMEYLHKSDTTTVCHWKGVASYYSLEIDGERNTDAAWYYADPKPLADGIRNRIAFWKGVKVIDD